MTTITIVGRGESQLRVNQGGFCLQMQLLSASIAPMPRIGGSETVQAEALQASTSHRCPKLLATAPRSLLTTSPKRRNSWNSIQTLHTRQAPNGVVGRACTLGEGSRSLLLAAMTTRTRPVDTSRLGSRAISILRTRKFSLAVLEYSFGVPRAENLN